MTGNATEKANTYLYNPTIANWQELEVRQNLATVIMAEVSWGEREGTYSKPFGRYDKFMNTAYHNFNWSYFRAKAHQQLVWCPQHRRFEKIRHIERIDSIRSVSGCRMEGNIAYLALNINVLNKNSSNKIVTAPVCWKLKRLFDGSVDIQAEFLSMAIDLNSGEYTISLVDDNIESCRMIVGENFHIGARSINFSPEGKDWSDFNLDIPTIIAKQATSYLFQAAESDAYIPPDSTTYGYKKLRAFTRRPEDLHIEYWREIIGDYFDKLFPKKQKNSFLALCKYLNLTPTASLTEGYEKNPFAPLWAALLRNWGFKEEKNIARFYELTEFAGILPKQFEIVNPNVTFHRHYEIVMINHATGKVKYSDTNDVKNAFYCPEVQGYLAENLLLERFEKLCDYVVWALRETSEENLTKNCLFPLATKPWTMEVYDELENLSYLSSEYLLPEERTLSLAAKKHLTNYNKNWRGSVWLREHDKTMEELERIVNLWDERYMKETEDIASKPPKPAPNLSRTIRLIIIYDKLLNGKTIRAKDYGYLTMFGRDMKVLRSFEASISYRPKDGNYKIMNIEKKYDADGSGITPVNDKSRKVRLLTYVRFLHDCGFLNRKIAAIIAGKTIPRRTFVRDVEILRRAFPKRELIYDAQNKRYVWKEGVNREGH